MKLKETLLISISFFLSACFVKKQSLYTDHNLKETFRYPIVSEPPTLDWNKSTDTTSSLVIQNIMEGLTEYDFSKKHVQLKPALAESWTSSSDKKIWTFHLKKNVLWTDGKKLSPQDFISAWERLLNPKTGSEYAYFLFPIKKAQEYNQGLIKDFKKSRSARRRSRRINCRIKQSSVLFSLSINSSLYFSYSQRCY